MSNPSNSLTPVPLTEPISTPDAPLGWPQSSWGDPTGDSLEQLFHVFFKYKRLVIGTFLAFLTAAGVAGYLQPPPAKAVAKILLKPDRVSLQISDLVPNRAGYSLQEMQSEIELIESRDVLEPVARTLLGNGSSLADADVEQKINSILGRLSAVALPQTSVIELTYSASSSEHAETVLSEIIRQYLSHHADAYSGSAALLRFYQTERQQAQAHLDEVEDKLRDWQKENRIIAIDQQISGLLDALNNQERQLHDNNASVPVAVQQSPLLLQLRESLSAAEVELNNARQRYMENDRHVLEKKQQVALIAGQIAKARTALLHSLSSQGATLSRQIEETRGVLEALRAKKLEGERLQQAVDIARSNMVLYSKKLEEARISAGLEDKQLSNLTVIENPHGVDPQAQLLERAAMMPVGAVVGLLLGAAVALGLEFFNRSLRTRKDVETYLQLPVLATIPLLRSPTR